MPSPNTDQTLLKLRKRIKEAPSDLPPRFDGMKLVRYVRQGRGPDADFAWAIYISHDPCHDRRGHKANRHTVLAVHRLNGTFKILGRELPLKHARALAKGEL